MKIRVVRIFWLPFILNVIVSPAPTFAWGNDGHTYVNRVAAQKIPASMPSFLKTSLALARIEYLGPEPDRWRGSSKYALNNAQSPDHFIDLERIQGLGDMPRGRYDFYRMLYDKRAITKTNPDDYLPEHVGLQPYITIEIFERLQTAFREYRKLAQAAQPTDPVEQAIIFYAGWLGHYVADGSQPLHTTINYDGWVAGNPHGFTIAHGIHRRFESDFVSRDITATDFASLVGSPHKLADPFGEYLHYLGVSHALVERVYELDKLKAFDGAGAPDALQFTQERLAASSQMLLDLWYTAWLQSAE